MNLLVPIISNAFDAGFVEQNGVTEILEEPNVPVPKGLLLLVRVHSPRRTLWITDAEQRIIL